MAARLILSVIPGGLRILIHSWRAMRWGKRQANKSVKIFEKTLQEQDLSEEVIKELSAVYQANADFLSIRGLSQLAFQAVRSRPRRK
ncbi:MAG: hypothetical protein Q6364_12620 [Candidatus Hermodarchaeota archaeon]|nr:hypothetical protein [Candidatus Hermodarchaeota archaeon]